MQGWVLSWVVVAHTSPLPRVFLSISEEYIVSLDISTTVEFISLVSFRLNFFKENTFAVSWPERQRNLFTSNWCCTGGLEEAKLIAILPSPLPTSTVNVDRRGFP